MPYDKQSHRILRPSNMIQLNKSTVHEFNLLDDSNGRHFDCRFAVHRSSHRKLLPSDVVVFSLRRLVDA